MSSLRDRVTLYRRVGASNRVHNAEIVRQGDGFVVNVAYGRRGGTLKTATKPSKPVPRHKAQQIYSDLMMDRLVDTFTASTDPSPCTSR